MTQVQYQRTKSQLLAMAHLHKRQASFHRKKLREKMETLRRLREKMARLGIAVEVVAKK